MAIEPKRVVVIQDASREINSEAIQKTTKMLPLKAGDQLTIVPILDWFCSPSTFSCFGRKRLGYMMKVDSDFVSPNKKIIEKELSKRKEEYSSNPDMIKLSESLRENEITFKIEVLVGPATEVVNHAARDFQATGLIFDRQMYKEMKHYIHKLTCRLYKITSNNSIQKVKFPKPVDNTKPIAKWQENVSNTEMNQASIEEQLSLPRSKSSSSDIFSSTGVSSNWSTEASTSSLGGSRYSIQKYQEGKFSSNIEQTIGNKSLFYISRNQETSQIDVNLKERPDDYQEQHENSNEASDVEKEFTNPLCSVCNNRRPKVGSKRDFSYSELYNATCGFSQKNFLSEGGFGEVYKGQLNGMMIAVKQHKSASFQGEKEFKSEVNVLSRAKHENVVMLLGSCSEKNSRLLVYEYVCNGSLDQHLSEHSRSPLSWKERIRVAIGAANGLLYLHNNNIIHRDMRPNNILITHDHHPLLGDFGLAKTQNHDSIHSTEVVGTLGYLAPEYAECGKVSTKTDVYSFGVVLLQLITGMRTTDKRLGGRSLVGWARPLLRDRNYSDLADERINDSLNIHQLFWMVRLAEKCLSRDPQKRLNMVAVVDALNGIMEGSICDIKMKDYSPARSDSFYSESECDESKEDMQGYESEGESQSHATESTATDFTGQMMHMFVKQPPSPPIMNPIISSAFSSLSLFNDQSTILCKAQNEGNVEMLNSIEGLSNV